MSEELSEECCAKCRFYHLYARDAKSDFLGRSCVRYPPAHFLGWDFDGENKPKKPEELFWLWVSPAVAANGWCGEFSPRKHHPLMDLPLTETSLLGRCQQVLEKNDIDTIGKLISRSVDDLLRLPRFGKTHLSQVLKMLKKHYLSLADNSTSTDPTP